jgi:hypothetical protein
MAIYGGGYVGVVGHLWYEHLDRWACARYVPGSKRFLGAKLVADLLIFGPSCDVVFFSYMGAVRGHSLLTIADKFRNDFAGTFVADLFIWVPTMLANFAFVPVKYQLLVVNFVSVPYAGFMSWVGHQYSWVQTAKQWWFGGNPDVDTLEHTG